MSSKEYVRGPGTSVNSDEDGNTFVITSRALVRDTEVSRDARLLGVLLESFAFGRKTESRPSQRTLAGYMGVTVRHTQTLLKELVNSGHIEVSKKGKRNVYRLLDRVRQANCASPNRRTVVRAASLGEEEKEKKHQPPVGGEGEESTSTKGKHTWMTPYYDIWEEAYGGEMPCTKFSKPLKKVEDKVGIEEAVNRWRNYCSKTEGRFADAHRFSSTHGEYSQQAAAANDPYAHFERRGGA